MVDCTSCLVQAGVPEDRLRNTKTHPEGKQRESNFIVQNWSKRYLLGRLCCNDSPGLCEDSKSGTDWIRGLHYTWEVQPPRLPQSRLQPPRAPVPSPSPARQSSVSATVLLQLAGNQCRLQSNLQGCRYTYQHGVDLDRDKTENVADNNQDQQIR